MQKYGSITDSMGEQVSTEFTTKRPPELLYPTTKENKDSNWRAMERYVNTIVDKLGLGIDEGINQAVIAMNVLNINTSQSCEGHIDRGIAAPWIDIQAKETEETKATYKKAIEAYSLAESREAEGAPDDELERLYNEYHRLMAEARRPTLEEYKKVMRFLTEFYIDRRVRFDKQLIIVDYKDMGRLQSQGALTQEIEELDVRQQKLTEYQEEMRDFSTFLKKKYFTE